MREWMREIGLRKESLRKSVKEMHELGLTREVIRIILEAKREERLVDVTAATVRLGALTTYKPDPLLYYFDILKRENGLENCALAVVQEPGRVHCRSCGAEGEAAEQTGPLLPLCPFCGSPDVAILGGADAHVDDVSGTQR